MKTLFATALVGLLLSCSDTQACDSILASSSSRSLTIVQAKGALNRALLGLNKNQGDLKVISDVDCYLKSHTALLSRLNEISDSLSLLGQQLDQARSSEQITDAVDTIRRLVKRDAGTGLISLPNSELQINQINLYDDVIHPHCTRDASRECTRATELAKKLWWIVGEYRAFANNKENHQVP